MDFNNILIQFGEKIGPAEQDAVRKYMERLISNDVPVILSPEHISKISNIKTEALYSMSNSQNSYYRSFHIPKKTGGRRKIDAPLPSLAYVQRWILDYILTRIELHPSAKAYRSGYSTYDNARFHRKQKILYQIDIKDFFGSIKENAVFKIFYDLGYTKRVSKLLSMISTYQGTLPQGAPTSGSISNILMKKFDESIFLFCKESGIRYTRYADDLTFSGKELNTEEVRRKVDKELSRLHLRINNKKTRTLLPHVRQEVTGLVVNEKISVPQSFRRQLRQECYFIKRFGIYGHAREINAPSPRILLEATIGKLAYVKAIHKNELFWTENHKIMLNMRETLF